jgi:hypothetical protein
MEERRRKVFFVYVLVFVFVMHGFDLLASLGICNQLLTWNFFLTTCISHHFPYSIDKKYCTKLKTHLMAGATYFYCFPYIHLNVFHVYMPSIGTKVNFGNHDSQ